MKKKIFFLVNNLEEFCSYDLLKKYLYDVSITVGETFPEHPEDYDLVILWNYKKIIHGLNGISNIILFHASDLPKGKGWAPIYYTIVNKEEYYTITGLFAANEVDSGDIIVKARFKMKDNYTATILRQWDNDISLILIKKILEKFKDKPLKGMKQTGNETYFKRRYRDDNEISLDERLKEIVDKLRASEPQHPAFFFYNGYKYFIFIQPEFEPKFPDDLEIIFYDSTQ